MKDFKTIPAGIKHFTEEELELIDLLDTSDVPSIEEKEELYLVTTAHDGHPKLSLSVMTMPELLQLHEEFEAEYDGTGFSSSWGGQIAYRTYDEIVRMFQEKSL